MKKFLIMVIVLVFLVLALPPVVGAQYYRGSLGFRGYYDNGNGYCDWYGYGGNSAVHFPGGFSICNPDPAEAWSSPFMMLYYLREFRALNPTPRYRYDIYLHYDRDRGESGDDYDNYDDLR